MTANETPAEIVVSFPLNADGTRDMKAFAEATRIINREVFAAIEDRHGYGFGGALEAHNVRADLLRHGRAEFYGKTFVVK